MTPDSDRRRTAFTMDGTRDVVDAAHISGRVDYDGAAPGYRRTRTVAPAVLDIWRRALAPYFDRSVRRVVDIGAGTGQFAGPIADWFDTDVVAVEPSSGMRRAAARHARVGFVAGRGEALPLMSRSVDRAWLSAVVHHFTDLASAIGEVRRVLIPRGRVLIRGFFSDVDPPPLFAAFPGIDRSTAAFPSSGNVADALGAAGMKVLATGDIVEAHDVPNPWESRLRELRSVDSLLRPLTDQEFEAGIDTLARQLPCDVTTLTHRATLRLLVAEAP
jgi:SAM-dependent methyltransferase